MFSLSCSGGGGGPKLYPVEGKVLYKNEPAAGALVTFNPKGGSEVTALRPTGLVKNDGTFKVATGKDDGAPTGEYVITITWQEAIPRKRMSMEPPETRDKLNGAYGNRATSKFKVEVKSGANKLDPFVLQ